MKRLLCLVLLSLLPGRAAAQTTNAPAGTNPMAAMAGILQAFQGATNPNTGAPPFDGDAMAAAAKFIQAFQGGTNNPLAAVGGQPAVDFRELRAFLPEELAGLPRTDSYGRKTGALGANISEATGEYGQPDGASIEVKITDLGAMGPFGGLAGFGWMSVDVDSEGDSGYERTTMFRGRKGLEKYSTAEKSGSIDLMTGGRFMIAIKGRGIEPAMLKSVAESLDLDALDRLAKRPQFEQR